jgi:hypothetical protein
MRHGGRHGRRENHVQALLGSGALAALALGAAMIMDGDWQAALPAVAGLSGGAFLISLIRLLAIGERPARPNPRPAARLSSSPC